MAEIFLAKQVGPLGFERDVVIKRLKPELHDQEEFLQMFLDEVRLAAHLSHPNVVQIHDVGSIRGQYFLCMEYLAGDDLGQILRECTRKEQEVPPMLGAELIAQAAHGLHYAHELRDADGQPLHIVHRDISPGNLFVTYQGHVKVLDFGVARAEARIVNTGGGRLKGKTPYIAPELLTGRPADPRSDVYALALTLYEVLTRHRPFLRENALATLRAVREGQIAPISHFRDDVPPELVAIVDKGVEKDPERRYQTAGEFGAALEGFLSAYTASTAHRAATAWLRFLLGDERIRHRSYVPSLAVLQSRGLQVSGFSETPSQPVTPAKTPPATAVAPPPASEPVAAASSALSSPRALTPAPVPAPLLAPAAASSAPRSTAEVRSLRSRLALPAALAASALVLIATGSAAAALLTAPAPSEAAASPAVVASAPAAPSPAEPVGSPGMDQMISSAPPTLERLKPVLIVDCDVPSAGVELDGVSVGSCPLQLEASPGAHTVVARAEGRQPATRTVEISERDDRTVVWMQLPPLPVATTVTLAVAPVRNGQLTLDTVPWTRVYRGGRFLGETPLVEKDLPPGRHVLRLVNAEQGIERRVVVVVRAGQKTVKRLELGGR